MWFPKLIPLVTLMTETVDDAIARLDLRAELHEVVRKALELFGRSSVDVYTRNGDLIIATPLNVEIFMGYSAYHGKIYVRCYKTGDVQTVRFLGIRTEHSSVHMVCNWLTRVAKFIEAKTKR